MRNRRMTLKHIDGHIRELEKLYLTAVKGFYLRLIEEELSQIGAGFPKLKGVRFSGCNSYELLGCEGQYQTVKKIKDGRQTAFLVTGPEQLHRLVQLCSRAAPCFGSPKIIKVPKR